MRKKKKKIGLTLSGGGSRGVIHIGVLHAFEKYNIMPNAISGTSMGAIIAAFYAHGISPLEILNTFKKSSIRNFFKLLISKKGIFSLKMLEKLIVNNIPHDNFNDLKIPLFVCTTNLTLGQTHFFSSGTLSNKLMASSTIPILFPAIEIDGHQYIDGGLLNNLPIEPILEICDTTIGVHVNNVPPSPRYSNMREIGIRTFSLAIAQNVKQNSSKCDYLIEPKLNKYYDFLDFNALDELFSIGYEHGEALIKKHLL
ncbi:patatin-like phospholipase family protein [Aureibacter tunicatorum]|uniref:NTE family protein n=1 Tax=Aureibacter tunicatorum TaxID=866807 RepID=A0AAE4BSN7_9BACT|nr:patatin-like phospholipase family protein [Aureibacter tunicatorum]MDR6239050.1 NTE family protein [Aureibacter tunicatorum]BDD05024.1 phospholipase [Aureibacter tunicatorum]